MIFSILKILVVIAVCQTILLVIHLFRQKGPRFSRTLLTMLFLCFMIFLSGYLFLFIKTGFLIKLGHLANLFIFLAAPLLYLYILSVISGKSSITSKDWLHGLPFAIVFLILLGYLINDPKKVFAFTYFGVALLGCLFLQNIFYLALIFKRLKARNINLISTRLSTLEGESKWITFLVRIFVIVVAIQLLIFIICNIFSLIPFCVILTGIFFVFSFLIVNSLMLLGLSNPNFFSEGRRYGTSSLNPDLIPVYIDKLTYALTEEKVYLDPLMTMEKLGKKLRIPKNHLSQIINQQYKSNYNGMINKYRIDEATRLMMASRDESTIIGIAYSVGFNSKSTFNTAFKKMAGMTPTEYIANQQGLS